MDVGQDGAGSGWCRCWEAGMVQLQGVADVGSPGTDAGRCYVEGFDMFKKWLCWAEVQMMQPCGQPNGMVAAAWLPCCTALVLVVCDPDS